jgi:hypothetical protein
MAEVVEHLNSSARPQVQAPVLQNKNNQLTKQKVAMCSLRPNAKHKRMLVASTTERCSRILEQTLAKTSK